MYTRHTSSRSHTSDLHAVTMTFQHLSHRKTQALYTDVEEIGAKCEVQVCRRAAEYLTNEYPRKVRQDNFKCVNCNEKHPDNYRGCMVHKQIKKNTPKIKGRKYSNKTDSVRSNTCSSSSWANQNTPNKCN